MKLAVQPPCVMRLKVHLLDIHPESLAAVQHL